MKLKNITQLREVQLQMIDDLIGKKVEVEEAGVAAKLFETVLSGCKTQMEYHRLTNTVPHIPFLHEEGKALIEGKQEMKLIGKK